MAFVHITIKSQAKYLADINKNYCICKPHSAMCNCAYLPQFWTVRDCSTVGQAARIVPQAIGNTQPSDVPGLVETQVNEDYNYEMQMQGLTPDKLELLPDPTAFGCVVRLIFQ